MLICLVLVCSVAGGLLAFINSQTSEVIAQQIINTTLDGIKAVAPEYDNDPYKEQFKVAVDGDSLTVYPATKAGETVGYAVESTSHNGFSGDVRILVGIDTDNNLIDYTVLEQNETPGLGAHVTHWFHSEAHPTSDVRGKSLTEPLKVTKDNGSIDAITAATITSRAFLDAVNKAMRGVQTIDGVPGQSGETTSETVGTTAEPTMVDNDLLLSLLPEHDNDPVAEQSVITDATGYNYTVYPATRGGIWQGAAITAPTESGYNGPMLFIAALDAGNHLLDYAVLQESESEQLGGQVAQWFRDNSHPTSDIRGRSLETPLKVTQDGGDIDAISGATVTSRAFLDAISRTAAIATQARTAYENAEN